MRRMKLGKKNIEDKVQRTKDEIKYKQRKYDQREKEKEGT